MNYRSEYHYDFKLSETIQSTFSHEWLDKSIAWNIFIEKLNLGIISHPLYIHNYKIVDEQRWLLACIKYGLYHHK